VYGYLEDFLFPPERARSQVKTLSGGERNRLLLARLLTQPANVLVLDEPTNDLDIETLELLEARLVEYPGTLLVVSHDRRFLDNVVTSTLVFEGGGVVREYVGGYEDWARQRLIPAPTAAPEKTPRGSKAPKPKPARTARLSFNERREFDALPDRIAALEREQTELEARVAAPAFYKEGADAIAATLQRIEDARSELNQAFARWDELDSRS